jgi:hypothetical protein
MNEVGTIKYQQFITDATSPLPHDEEKENIAPSAATFSPLLGV